MSFEEIVRVLTLQDYNTRVVVLGTSALGMASGLIGTFMLLRKRSLMADAVSHATLPGIGVAFLLMVAAGGQGKWLPGLLLGALVSGLVGMGLVLLIRSLTRIKEDAALGIVLSVFFGLGVSILGVIQKMSTGSAAGLESFIYGKTASMLASDAYLIGGVGLLVVIVCALLTKEFTLLCFDQDFAASEGWPVHLLDVLLMAMVVVVTVIGLQAVGLILVIALLIIPPASARFWTEDLRRMAFVAILFGGLGGAFGAALSALVPRLPAGAIIVITTSVFFVLSLVFGTARGLVVRFLEQWRLGRSIEGQHLLRALFEWEELRPGEPCSFEWLLAERSWSPAQLRRVLARALRRGLVEGEYRLTERGQGAAARVVRNHRLWELYLITHADIAPSHVDRDADMIEHVLSRETLAELELLLEQSAQVPSPHRLQCRSRV